MSALYFILKPKKWISLYWVLLILENVLKVYINSELIEILMYSVEIYTYIICVKCILFASKNRCFTINKIDIWITIFFLVSLLSSIVNFVSPKIFILGIRWFLRYISVYFIIKTENWDDIEKKRIMNFIVHTGVLQIIIGFLQVISSGKIDKFLRVSDEVRNNIFSIFGTVGRYNEYAFIIVILISILFARYQLKITKKYIYLIFSFICLIFSYSRQALVGILIGIIIVALLDNKQKIGRRKMISIVFVITLSMSIILSYINIEVGKGTVNDGLVSRFMSIFTKDYIEFDFNNKGRLYFMFYVNKLFLFTKPLLGYGMGMYGTEAAISLDQSVYNLLNIPIQFSMDVFWQSVIGQVGVIGLITLIIIYSCIIKRGIIAYKSDNIIQKEIGIIVILLMVTGIIMSFFSCAMNDRYYAFMIWCFIGLLCTGDKKVQR